MTRTAKLETCQTRLAALWLGGSAVLFTLVLIQSLAGKYGEQTGAAWSWLMPAIIPTLSLIVGAVAYSASTAKHDVTVNRLAFRIAASLSLFYLLLLLATLLADPLIDWITALQLLELSKLWLGPVQGLVGLSLGAFFVSRET